MTRQKLTFLGIFIVLALTIVVAPCSFASDKLPNTIGIITYSAGSKNYAISTGIAHAIQKYSGIRVMVVPGGTNRAKALSVVNKETVLGVGYENGWYGVQGGVWDFSKEGPQDLRMAWLGAAGCTSMIWKKDSGIKTMQDLKGKRVGYYGDYDQGTNMLVTGFLAFGGLTWDDVIPFSTTYGKGMNALLDGKVDAAYNSPASSQVQELAATVHGAMVAEFPPDQTQNWKKLLKSCPVVGPGKVTVGYRASKSDPKDWPIYAGYLITRTDTNPELIATLIKAMTKGYNEYKDSHPEAADWTIENALNLDLLKMTGWAYHEGAVKAFKELGYWTEQLQEWQDNRIEFSNKLKKAYKQAEEEAKGKNIEVGSPEFMKLWEPRWLQMRTDLAENQE